MVKSDDPQIVLLFMFVGLFAGAVITFLLTRHLKGLPYTVVVFIVGLIAAVIDNYSHWPIISISLDMWSHFPPQLILFIFLPALLFGESMTLNPHHARSAIASSLLLAVPGALIGMYMLAALAYWGLPYNWSWNVCCVLGAILCATDPVAVVALLNRLNASANLTIVVVMEALLNDGSALVLFNLYYTVLSGNEAALEPGNVTLFFLKVCLVSPVLGFVLGALSVAGMGLANRRLKSDDHTIQMAITLSCAYLSFFIGEYLVHVSGVICCCCAGFMISLLGKPLVLDHETMHSVWSAIEWIGNTLLFLLAGLIIGDRIVHYSQLSDFGYIVVVYIYLMIVRALLVIGFFPILSRLGHGLTIKEGLFVIWGGLRGGVCLALVLVLEYGSKNKLIDLAPEESSRLIILVGGVATLTLIINAMTSSAVLKKLELVKKGTEDQRILLHYVQKRLRKRVKALLATLNKTLPYIDFALVASFCSVLEGEQAPTAVEIDTSQESISPVKHKRKSEDSLDESSSMHALEHSTLLRNPYSAIIDDLLYRTRATFLEVVRHIYWKHIKAGKLPRNSQAAALLLYSIDVGLDTIHTPGLQDWDQLSKSANVSTEKPSMFSQLFIGDPTETAVFLLLSFIEAHEEAQKKIPYYLGETEEADTPEEALVVKESMDSVELAKAKLRLVPLETIELCHSKQAARMVLHAQEELIEELREEGILQEKDATMLLNSIQSDFANLARNNSTVRRFINGLFSNRTTGHPIGGQVVAAVSNSSVEETVVFDDVENQSEFGKPVLKLEGLDKPDTSSYLNKSD